MKVQRILCIGKFTIRCFDDHMSLISPFPENGKCLQSVQSRHLYIQDQQLRIFLCHGFYYLGAILCIRQKHCFRIIPFQEKMHCLKLQFFIISNQYPIHKLSSYGILILISVPSSGVDIISIANPSLKNAFILSITFFRPILSEWIPVWSVPSI